MSGSPRTLAQSVHSVFDVAETALARAPVWLACAAALFAFQLFLIWSHEAWADEMQALLIALEAPGLPSLMEWLTYEGHPPLWYWLLRVLGNLVEPHIVLPLAATLCAAITQGAILFASPFSRLERLFIALSQFMLFEFLTIARGTSLGVAIFVLALVAWRSRWFWLLMAALPLVDFLFGVLSGVLLVLKWREKDLWWPGVAAWLAGSVFAAWTVIPASDMVSAHEAMNMPSGLLLWAQQVTALLVPFQGGLQPQWNSPVVPISMIGWIVFLALCLYATMERPWHTAVMFGFLGFTLAFSLVIYPIGLRHLMLAAMLLIGLSWLARTQDAPPSSAFRSWIALAAICGVASSLISTNKGFDSADQVLAEIEMRGLSDKHWIALPEWRVPSVAGRSDLAFTRAESACTFRFVRWDHKSEALAGSEQFESFLHETISNYGKVHLLSDIRFSGFDESLIVPLAEVPPGYNGIGYYLYTVGPQAPEKPSDLRPCSE